jgi:hypothetical protein
MPQARVASPQSGGSAGRRVRSSTCPPCLYVANQVGDNVGSILVFPVGASGNVKPTQDITGRNTEIEKPTGVAVDGSGDIYEVDGSGGIYEFAAGATGNVSPSAAISGGLTGLANPSGIALDNSNNIYVSNFGNITDPGGVEVFAAGSNGNVAPSAIIAGYSTNLANPSGVAVDGNQNIYATSATISINEFAAGSNGNVAPSATISGKKTDLDLPVGVTLDANANIYVTNNGVAAILAYAAGSNGDVAPIELIKTTKCTQSCHIALDGSGNIYVSGQKAIYEFAKGANGKVKPIRVLKGKKTLITGADGIAIR